MNFKALFNTFTGIFEKTKKRSQPSLRLTEPLDIVATRILPLVTILRLPLARQGQNESFRQPPASFVRFLHSSTPITIIPTTQTGTRRRGWR